MLKTIREKAGLTQSALAERAGVPLRSVQNWEQGHRVPRMQNLPRLAKAMGVSVNDLVAGIVEEKIGTEPPKRRGKPKKK
jgi:transcriptional regulator with XRE-family HTH domain